jgi:GntR family transcriptional regulator
MFLILREQIARGAPPPGASLPTEEALCNEFGVSRITVRRALQDLEAQGLVERRQGRGTYVIEAGSLGRSAAPLSLVEGLRKVAMETQVDVVEVGRRRVPPSVAALLKVPSGADGVYALRVRRSGKTPLMVTEAWLPPRFVDVASPSALRRHALYELLLKAGVKFGRVIQELSAEAAEPRRARLLEIDIGAPLIRVVRLLHDADGTPVQHLTVYLSPERSRLVMDISADDVDSLSAGHVMHDVSRDPENPGARVTTRTRSMRRRPSTARA